MADDAHASTFDASLLMESPLTEDERNVRDLFVNEYMKDFDPFQACLRIGFMAAFAIEWAKRFMSESYVQRKIAELTRRPPENSAEQDAIDRALLENTYREAMQRGPYQSRIAAGRAFAAMKGWEKPDAAENAEQGLIEALKDFATKAPA